MSEMLRESRYQDGAHLADGGTSTIYRVFDNVLRRTVAMKVLHPDSREQPGEEQRFLEEAQITAQLEHPNIVPVYDLGAGGAGERYFTLKLVKGNTLLELLHQTPYDPGSEADLYRFLQIFLKVCDALSFAHSHGIIHRDLKPENIMVGSHGQVYLMDWGLVRVVTPDVDFAADAEAREGVDILRDTKTLDLDTQGEAMGSFLYLPPEQAHGWLEQIDERTDVFALGAILYEILTKKPIYFGWSHEELLAKAKACEIEPPQAVDPQVHVPTKLCDIATRALQRDPGERYPTVESMQQELTFFLQGSGRLPRQQFAAGETIVQEGEIGECAFLIVRGRCEVSKQLAGPNADASDGQRVHLRTLAPSDVFGETAAFSSRLRTATVTALDDVEVKVIERRTLEQEFGFGSWINRVLRALASRFAEMDRETMAQRKALDEATLLNHILLQLQMHGQRYGSHLQGPWSQVALHLHEALSLDTDTLEDLVLGLDAFSLDRDNDLLMCDPERLLRHLSSPR